MEKSTKKCPPYHLIVSAADGDERAMDKLLQFYDSYISKASLRPLCDEFGNVAIVVDMELKGLIREAMAVKMEQFEVVIKN